MFHVFRLFYRDIYLLILLLLKVIIIMYQNCSQILWFKYFILIIYLSVSSGNATAICNDIALSKHMDPLGAMWILCEIYTHNFILNTNVTNKLNYNII